ncbi:MAG: hypothetical protein L3J13_06140, partial [Devosiaceae bacterium]|nr:hypothetical protein [Devosiaceae bacterium]
ILDRMAVFTDSFPVSKIRRMAGMDRSGFPFSFNQYSHLYASITLDLFPSKMHISTICDRLPIANSVLKMTKL